MTGSTVSRRTPAGRLWRWCVGRAALGLLLAVPALVTQAAPEAAASAPRGDARRGEQLYRTGQLPDGRGVVAQRPGVGRLAPADAACAACHRPSGRGSTEGGQLVPPIAGPVLFAPGRPPSEHPRLQRQWLRHQQRPAYDDTRLARALTEGVDAGGQPLSVVMPRYTLDAGTQADLTAYLRQLGARPAPGLTDQVLHLATIVTPDAPDSRRDVVLQAMHAWTDGLRIGPWAVRWQPWRLAGARESWAGQLDALFRRQPVFALVSGAGGSHWDTIDRWCEARRVPCLMPVVDTAPHEVSGQPRHWSLHLSQGTLGDAALMTRALRERPARRVLQIVDSPAGELGAARLRQGLTGPDTVVETRIWSAGGPRPSSDAADHVVLWLAPSRVTAWLADETPRDERQVLLSGQLAPPALTAIATAWRPHVQWASLRADPVRQQAGAALSLSPWAQRLGLQRWLDTPDLADIHAATHFVGDALARMQGVGDTQYLLERLEGGVDRRPAGAAYARLSLGPAQRIAAQGGHLLGFRSATDAQPVPVTPFWRVAE